MDELISRQAAIDMLQNHYEVRNTAQNETMDECVMIARELPSAQKHWEWIWMDAPMFGNPYGSYKCECGICVPYKTNYCPHCGARMDGE